MPSMESEIYGMDRETLRGIATRALVECCDDCRALLRDQLMREEHNEPQVLLDPTLEPDER